jgi:hypothetical protein
MLEDFARKNKCVGIRTETWNFQSVNFYIKNKMEIFAQLNDHPVGATDYFLKKKF